jgi:hypothetical protein
MQHRSVPASPRSLPGRAIAPGPDDEQGSCSAHPPLISPAAAQPRPAVVRAVGRMTREFTSVVYAQQGDTETACFVHDRPTDMVLTGHDDPVSKRDASASRAARALDAAGGLVHRGEIAKRLPPGLTLQRVRTITEGEDFPAPYVVLGGWPIWIEADVAQWAQQRGREWLPGDAPPGK